MSCHEENKVHSSQDQYRESGGKDGNHCLVETCLSAIKWHIHCRSPFLSFSPWLWAGVSWTAYTWFLGSQGRWIMHLTFLSPPLHIKVEHLPVNWCFCLKAINNGNYWKNKHMEWKELHFLWHAWWGLPQFWDTHNQKLKEILRLTHHVIASKLHCYATPEEVFKFKSYPPKRGE